MQVDAAVKWMLLGVEAPAVSSSGACLFPRLSLPQWEAEEGASISIKRVQATANSLRSCLAAAIGGA